MPDCCHEARRTLPRRPLPRWIYFGLFFLQPVSSAQATPTSNNAALAAISAGVDGMDFMNKSGFCP